MKEAITKIFAQVFTEQRPDTEIPVLDDTTVLLETGLDSLGFAILVVKLEEELGFDPFTISSQAYYPTTFGDFVTFYEANKPT